MMMHYQSVAHKTTRIAIIDILQKVNDVWRHAKNMSVLLAAAHTNLYENYFSLCCSIIITMMVALMMMMMMMMHKVRWQ